MFTIAKCTEQHIAQVARLNLIVQALHAQTHPEQFKSEVSSSALEQEFSVVLADPNHYIFIALTSSQVIGYAWCFYHERAEKILTQASNTIYINHIGVDPEFAKMGVGTHLMQAVDALAQERCVKKISLDYWTFNEPAAQFSAKNGYDPYNIKMWKEV
jgi:GNAT superfamily N-acetyltransferase